MKHIYPVSEEIHTCAGCVYKIKSYWNKDHMGDEFDWFCTISGKSDPHGGCVLTYVDPNRLPMSQSRITEPGEGEIHEEKEEASYDFSKFD